MDASRLFDDGIPVALADGEKVMVRFDFEALANLEEDYEEALDWARELDQSRTGKRLFTCVARGLIAGVRSRALTMADLDTRLIADYRRALMAAWIQAMPEPDPVSEVKQGKARSEVGTGRPSTTSRRSRSTAPKPSGAA